MWLCDFLLSLARGTLLGLCGFTEMACGFQCNRSPGAVVALAVVEAVIVFLVVAVVVAVAVRPEVEVAVFVVSSLR